MGVGGTGGVGGAGPSSAVGGLVGMGVDPGLAAAAVAAAANSGPSGPAVGSATPGTPGMMGSMGPGVTGPVGAGFAGPSAPSSGIGDGRHGSDSGFGVPGAPGTAHSSNRGDRGGPSIGSPGGPPSVGGRSAPDGGLLGTIGLAHMGSFADAVHGWGRGQSEHSMNSPSSQGFAPPGQTAMQDAIAAARGPGARGRAEAAALGDPRGQSPSGVRGGVPSDINSRAGMNSADYMGLLPDATQASLGGYPAGTAANRGRKGDFAGVRGHATAQDPGPRGMPAPDFAGPRHSSPTPSPVAQDQGFDVRADFGPVADTVFGGLRDARDAFSGMESRAGFQRGRVGGVGGGGVDPGLLGTLGRRANLNDPTSRGR